MQIYTPMDFYLNHSIDALLGQFIITQHKPYIPRNWHKIKIDGHWIGCHKSLPITLIPTAESTIQAYLVGYTIDYQQQTLNDIRPINSAVNFFDELEEYLYILSGRYICIATDGNDCRIYLDASGSLSLVYSVEYKIAASSIMLFPYNDETDDNIRLIEKIGIPKQKNVFYFGLTPRKSIKRLLPNHYLDLTSWKSVRHWPTGEFVTSELPEIDALNIAKILESTICTIIENGYQPYLSLTAGYDSRILLACAKNNIDSINFFTWELPDRTAYNDLLIANQIADKFNLRYLSYPFKDANQEDKNLWLYRTGLCAAEVRGLSLTTTVNNMRASQFYLPGLASGVGRGIAWKKGDHHSMQLSAEDLVTRTGLPLDEEILEAAQTWLDDLPSDDAFEILDFLHIEQRLGCWAGVTPYGFAAGPIWIHAFSNREIFDLMLRLPVAFRKNQELPKTIIRHYWPELMEFPFNPKYEIPPRVIPKA